MGACNKCGFDGSWTEFDPDDKSTWPEKNSVVVLRQSWEEMGEHGTPYPNSQLLVGVVDIQKIGDDTFLTCQRGPADNGFEKMWCSEDAKISWMRIEGIDPLELTYGGGAR